MLKKIFTTLLIAVFIPTLAFASQKSGYNAVLELALSKKINSVIQRVNSINKYINRYIIETAKIPTKNDLKTKYSLSNSDFSAYNKNQYFNFSINDNTVVKYTKVVPYFTGVKQDLYKNSPLLSPLSVINSDLSMDIALDPTTIDFLKQKEKYSLDGTISLSEPSDISKLWYKPNSLGGFVV